MYLNYRTLCLVVPSGECLRGYKPRAVDCSCLAQHVAATCLAKPSCYTLLYLACVPVLVLSCMAARLTVLLCVCASVFDICEIKNYFTLLYIAMIQYLRVCPKFPYAGAGFQVWFITFTITFNVFDAVYYIFTTAQWLRFHQDGTQKIYFRVPSKTTPTKNLSRSY